MASFLLSGHSDRFRSIPCSGNRSPAHYEQTHSLEAIFTVSAFSRYWTCCSVPVCGPNKYFLVIMVMHHFASGSIHSHHDHDE